MTKSKHNRYIQYVRHLIKDEYLSLSQEVIYKKPRSYNHLGEIDIMALTHEGRDIFEIKSNMSRKGLEKAINQLERAMHFFKDVGDAYLYTPQSGIISLQDAIDLHHKTYGGK